MSQWLYKHPFATLILGLIPLYGLAIGASLLPSPWAAIGVVSVLVSCFLWGVLVGYLLG